MKYWSKRSVPKQFVQGWCYACITWKKGSKFLCLYVHTHILYVLWLHWCSFTTLTILWFCIYAHTYVKGVKTFLCTPRYLGNPFWRFYKWRGFNIEGSHKQTYILQIHCFWVLPEFMDLVLYKNGSMCLKVFLSHRDEDGVSFGAVGDITFSSKWYTLSSVNCCLC